MENSSLSVSNQNAVFDLEPEKNRPMLQMMQASVVQAENCLHRASGGGFPGLKKDRTEAVAVSIFLHAVIAFILLAFAWQTPLSVITEKPKIIQVTWIDTSLLPDKDSSTVHLAAMKFPAAVVRQLRDAEKEQSLPDERKILSVPEAITKPSVTNPVNQASTALASGETMSAVARKDQSQVIALEQNVKSSGEDNAAAYTSMAKPRYRENVPPSYPLSARLKGYEGVVLITAEILAEGRAGDLKIKSSSGYGVLDQSALEAVRAWKFDPAKRMGKPVSAWVDIPVRFVLKNAR